MKKYMMIWKDENGDVHVHFFDLFQNMANARIDIWTLNAEMYVRDHIDGDPMAPEAYLPI